MIALIGFISTTKLTHCAFSLYPVIDYGARKRDGIGNRNLAINSCNMGVLYLTRPRGFYHCVIFFPGLLVYQPSMARTRTKIPEAIGETQNNLFSN